MNMHVPTQPLASNKEFLTGVYPFGILSQVTGRKICHLAGWHVMTYIISIIL